MSVKFTDGDPDKDFFTQNPHWKYLDTSIKLIKQVGAELASKIRWAVFLVEDPASPYFRYGKGRRVEIVNKNYLKDDYYFEYDDKNMKISNEEIDYLFREYAIETMSDIKRNYYERDLSYQILAQMERESNDLTKKADTQLKLSKIYEGLQKTKESFEEEVDEEKTKSRGRQQPGILFK